MISSISKGTLVLVLGVLWTCAPSTGIRRDSTAVIAPGVVLGAGSTVAAGVRLEQGVRIGERARINLGAVVERGAIIGDDVLIGRGARIGAGARIGSGMRVPPNTKIKPGALISDAADLARQAGTRSKSSRYPPPRTTMRGKRSKAGSRPYPHCRALTLKLREKVDPRDAMAVFKAVFAALPRELTVYPTENYLYYRFAGSRSDFWGNLRLAPGDRDKGILHFAYFEFNESPQGPEDFFSRYRRITPELGLKIKRRDSFTYSLTYEGRTVLFRLNRLGQKAPAARMVGPAEVWLQNTHDESGMGFLLLFNKKSQSFLWVLDPHAKAHETWVPAGADLVQGKRSGFVFYKDKARGGRRILVGVKRLNIKQNNYFDGPFDQLADNFIASSSPLSEFMQQAYPYSRGHIDRYGKFKHNNNSRIAITPYHAYARVSEMIAMVKWCRANKRGEQFYGCVAYDYKSRYR